MNVRSAASRWPVTCLLIMLASAADAAQPQTVYRCGPDGRVYSQTPCADGKVVTIEDSRSDQQLKAARDVAKRDAQQAQSLAEERKQREAAAAGQGATGIKAPPVESPASAPARKTKSKSPRGDPNMSPPMRVPSPATATK